MFRLTHPPGSGARFRRPVAALALLAFAQLIISVDYNIVYVALPEISDALDFSAQNLQWVISAYAVAFGGFLLLGGRACDVAGPRRMFVLGLVRSGLHHPADRGAVGLAVLVAIANRGGTGMTVEGLRVALFAAAAGILIAVVAALGFTSPRRSR